MNQHFAATEVALQQLPALPEIGKGTCRGPNKDDCLDVGVWLNGTQELLPVPAFSIQISTSLFDVPCQVGLSALQNTRTTSLEVNLC